MCQVRQVPTTRQSLQKPRRSQWVAVPISRPRLLQGCVLLWASAPTVDTWPQHSGMFPAMTGQLSPPPAHGEPGTQPGAMALTAGSGRPRPEPAVLHTTRRAAGLPGRRGDGRPRPSGQDSSSQTQGHGRSQVTEGVDSSLGGESPHRAGRDPAPALAAPIHSAFHSFVHAPLHCFPAPGHVCAAAHAWKLSFHP